MKFLRRLFETTRHLWPFRRRRPPMGMAEYIQGDLETRAASRYETRREARVREARKKLPRRPDPAALRLDGGGDDAPRSYPKPEDYRTRVLRDNTGKVIKEIRIPL